MHPHKVKDKKRNSDLRNTYILHVIMLMIGLVQAIVMVSNRTLRLIMCGSFSVSIFQFFVSCLGTQLYIFFFRMIENETLTTRILLNILMFELNTIAMMKFHGGAPLLSFAVAFVLTAIILAIGILFGLLTKDQKRGPFMNRPNIIIWSERIFVFTCLGITICSEINRQTAVLILLSVCSAMLTIFALIFAASIHKHQFYSDSKNDYVLVAQLLYMHNFGMFMCLAWNTESTIAWIKTNSAKTN